MNSRSIARGWCAPFLATALLFAGCGATDVVFPQDEVPRAARPPNILLVMVDDLGPEWIGAYGAEGIETPRIDALVAEGMRFDCAWSMPQCTPTRVTLLTGQYPFRHGWVNHWDVPRWGAGAHFDPEHNLTFARLLREAGYATAAAGKWQVNDFRVQPDAMDRHGFDEWAMWTGYEGGNPPSGERYWDPYVHTRDGSRTYGGRFGTDVFVDFLVDFMGRHRDEPMLLYFPMALTHGPLVPTPLQPAATGKMDKHRAMVCYVDHAVGRLVDALDELGLRENTVVIFTTDNGSDRGITGRMHGREVRGGKATLGDSGVRQPFVVRWPARVAAGTATEALVDFTDLLPTLAELAGVELPPGYACDGRSFAGVLDGTDPVGPRAWILSMGFSPARLEEGRVVPKVAWADRTVRDERFKLWVQNGESTALYDIYADPGETTNLLESEDPAAVTARAKLEALVRSFPAVDGAPRYDPLPPQPWDRKPRGK